ncbi:MAG: glycosyltransferase, partial [Clostridia bacterium]|nr:glycosyltransferase [Clostridia bacterium]
MKVLIINSVCGIGSTGRISTDLAEVLEKEGHECKVAYGRGVVPEKCKKYAVRIGSEMNVKIDGLKTRLFDNAGFNSAAATKKFLKWVREYNPDLIHLHNIHGYYINIELLFKFLKDFGKP